MTLEFINAQGVLPHDAIMVFSGSAHHRYTVSQVKDEGGDTVKLELHQYGWIEVPRLQRFMRG